MARPAGAKNGGNGPEGRDDVAHRLQGLKDKDRPGSEDRRGAERPSAGKPQVSPQQVNQKNGEHGRDGTDQIRPAPPAGDRRRGQQMRGKARRVEGSHGSGPGSVDESERDEVLCPFFGQTQSVERSWPADERSRFQPPGHVGVAGAVSAPDGERRVAHEECSVGRQENGSQDGVPADPPPSSLPEARCLPSRQTL